MKSIYQFANPVVKIGMIAFIALISLFVTFLLGAVLAIPFFGLDSFQALTTSSVALDEGNVGFLKYFQVVQSIGLFILPSLVIAYLFGDSVISYLQFKNRPLIKSILLSIFILITLNPIISIIGIWNSQFVFPEWLSGVEHWMRKSEDSAKLITELFLDTTSLSGLFVNVFMIAIIPAIGEEFLFRGIIQKVIFQWTKNQHWAIWIAAIVFSALHMQFYGFIPRVLLGAMFGYFFVWSQNLWIPVIAHFFNNASAVVAYYMYKRGALTVDPDSLSTDNSYWPLAIIGMLFGAFLIFKLIQFQKSERQLERVD